MLSNTLLNNSAQLMAINTNPNHSPHQLILMTWMRPLQLALVVIRRFWFILFFLNNK